MKTKNGSRRFFALLLTAAFVLAFSAPGASAAQKAGDTVIKVFETSDIHGYLMDTSSGDEASFQYRLAYIAQCVNSARASGEYDDVLLLDGGDVYQGAPTSNLLYGASMRAAMDQMNYDAFALGNHEFDWGVEDYCADADGTIPAYSLGEYSADPDTPIVASDLYYADTQERVDFTKDYIITEKAGCRIAVVGYVPDYRGSIMYARIAPYIIKPSLDALNARIREICEQEKPDVTVVLAHEDPVYIAAAMDPELVCLVAGGHTHEGISGYTENGVAYIQSDKYAVGYASACIVIDGESGKVRVEEPTYTQIIGTELEERLYETEENKPYLDPAVLAVSHAAWKAVGEGMGEVLGYIDSPVQKYGYIDSDNEATTGGCWITGFMMEKMKDFGVVAAFYNRGGVRADLVPEEGKTRDITVGDIFAINPFGNSWLIFELTGREIAQQLVNGLTTSNYGDQISGLSFTYCRLGEGEHAQYVISEITLSDGSLIDPEDTHTLYRICTTNYSSTLQGAVFEGKTPVVPEKDAPIDNIALIELLREKRDAGEPYFPVDTSRRATRLPVCGLHTDVSVTAWCHEAVDYVMENGLMVGVTKTQFAPSATLTSAMAAAALYRFANWPEVGETEVFADVPAGKWYSSAISWASESGVAAGYGNGIFGLNDTVTREQLVCFLWRLSGAPDADEAVLDGFADASAVSAWARQAMAWAVENGVIHGNAKGLLAPKDAAVRAELAQMLYMLRPADEIAA